MVGAWLKRKVRRVLASQGYALRDVGRGVGGVDLLHDARAVIGDVASPVLFDVGANVGQTTMAMLETFSSPIVRAFEPSPVTFEVLRQRLGRHTRVTTEALAFGDVVGVMPFHVTADHSVNDSLLKPTWNAGGSTVQVRVTTVDSYCIQRSIDEIHLLKIDTQGNDLKVLEGARGMLHRRKILAYCCEVNLAAMYEGQAQLNDVLAFGDQIGYELLGFYELSYASGRLSYLDVLFVSR